MERKQKWRRTQEGKDKDQRKLNRDREEVRGIRKVMRGKTLSRKKLNKLL